MRYCEPLMTGIKNLQMLIILAVSAVVINFAISVIKGRINIMHSERENQMWCYLGKVFADKQLSMDYVDIEDVNIQKRKDKEKYNLFNFGNGLAQFVWTINGTIEGVVSIAASVAMVATLFTSTSEKDVMDSPVWILAVFAAISIGMLINSKVFKMNNDM